MLNRMRAIHPGEILKTELLELDNMSANEFARRLAVPTNRITTILNGTRSITADSALRFARFFGTTAAFWLNLQDTYDLKIAIAKVGKSIDKNIAPFCKSTPSTRMRKTG